MEILTGIQNFITNLHLPVVLIIGFTIFIGFFAGKSMKFIRLPSIIGFMIIGVIIGPSLLNIINDEIKEGLSLITEMALGFVALSIGIELNLIELK